MYLTMIEQNVVRAALRDMSADPLEWMRKASERYSSGTGTFVLTDIPSDTTLGSIWQSIYKPAPAVEARKKGTGPLVLTYSGEIVIDVLFDDDADEHEELMAFGEVQESET